MSPVRKISFVTSSRADYGVLRPLLWKVHESDGLKLHLTVTGSHLSESHGYTLREIESDGVPVHEKVPILDKRETPLSTSHATGKVVSSLAEVFFRENPDIVVLLGDRYEMLGAGLAASLTRRIMVHISGGDLTLGAQDDAFRHCLTKLAHYHFCATDEYRNRILQMGECPDKVFALGELGMEEVLSLPFLSREEVWKRLNLGKGTDFVLLTFHPETLKPDFGLNDLNLLLKALDEHPELCVVITSPNADEGADLILQQLKRYVQIHPNRAFLFDSLGRLNYLSALRYSCGVIGNSSSGIVEAPLFQKPSLNIGERQNGRAYADSTLHAQGEFPAVRNALRRMLSDEHRALYKSVKSPYHKEGSTERACQLLSSLPVDESVLRKSFFDIPGWNRQSGI